MKKLARLAALLVAMGRASEAGATGERPDWRAMNAQMALILSASEAVDFPDNAILVNLGTSWGAGYLLLVRNAKRAFGLRYVPFVHDVIPLKAPQYCTKETVRRYLWKWSTARWLGALSPNASSTGCRRRPPRSTYRSSVAIGHGWRSKGTRRMCHGPDSFAGWASKPVAPTY